MSVNVRQGRASKVQAWTRRRERRTGLKRIAGARLTTIKSAGHLPNIERPREFNAAVLPFLLEHRDAAV